MMGYEGTLIASADADLALEILHGALSNRVDGATPRIMT